MTRPFFFKKSIHDDYNLNYNFKSINSLKKQADSIAVFTGGDAPPYSRCLPFLKARTFDFVITADSGLDTLDAYNAAAGSTVFAPDVILGDMDSLKNSRLLEKYRMKNGTPCLTEEFSTYKDFSDTELALMFAKGIKRNTAAVTLFGGSGGRADHFLAVFDLFSSSLAPDFWLTSEQVLVRLPAGKKMFILPGHEDEPVSVLRTTASNTAGFIKSSGLEWESHLFRKTGAASLSNVVKRSFFENKKPAEIQACGAVFVVCTSFEASVSIE